MKTPMKLDSPLKPTYAPIAIIRFEWLRSFSRWLLLGILFLAPWAYGATRIWTYELLSQLLGVLGICFLLSSFKWRPMPPLVPTLLFIGLLILGWGMTFNPYASYDAGNFAIIPRLPPFPGWPGTVDYHLSLSRLLLLTGLFFAFLTTCDMLSHSVWRDRLWTTLSISGLSIVSIGLCQHFADAKTIFWVWGDDSYGSLFFGPYRYHGNAGAFINLMLPLIIARMMLSFQKDTQQGKFFWTLASSVTIAAAFINLSRAAMVLTVGLLILLGGWFLLEWRQKRSRRKWETWTGVIAMLIAVVFLTLSFGLEATQTRWSKNADNLLDNSRYTAYEAIITYGLPSAGWRGVGPGVFPAVFNYYQLPYEKRLAGNWEHAHQDYLQTLLEWGWLGSALWAGFIFGGLGLGLVRLFKNYRSLSIQHRLFLGSACIALIGILLHAMVDFPLQIASLQLYTTVLLAVAWCLGKPKRHLMSSD